MYQFCFLVIRFDVCHHHSADLWLLSKEMVWWASVFQRGPVTKRQKVANSLFNFIRVASDGAKKCFGNVNGVEMKLSGAWEKGVEQFPSARTTGAPGLSSLSPCHSKVSGMGCLRGPSHSPRGVAQLLKALLFTWYLYWAMPWQFKPLTGQWGGVGCLWASGTA